MIGGRRLAPAVVGVALLLATGRPEAAPAAGDAGLRLQPHRAVYELALDRTRGNSSIDAVRGRIAFEFGGSSCDGYTLNFRQVTDIDSSSGNLVSDLRSATWEDGDGKGFRFTSQQFINRTLAEDVNGSAERDARDIKVRVTRPTERTLSLEDGVIFPTEHLRRIVAAARAGTPLFEVEVFDGSQGGEKVYRTLTVIGRPIRPGERPPADASRDAGDLASLTRWPVTISYFERKDGRAEQTPVYSITFELFENGISRALLLDYGDFVVRGEMTRIDLMPRPDCR